MDTPALDPRDEQSFRLIDDQATAAGTPVVAKILVAGATDTGQAGLAVRVLSSAAGSSVLGKVDQGTGGASAWKVDGSAVIQPVSGAFFQATQPVSAAALPLPTGAVALSDTFKTRPDTYTGTGNGVMLTASSAPLKEFAIQVKGTGAGATTWDIRLEGSLNGSDFTQILQHTNTAGDGTTVWLTTGSSPSLYIRSRCAGLVLGGASNVVVTILGVV